MMDGGPERDGLNSPASFRNGSPVRMERKAMRQRLDDENEV